MGRLRNYSSQTTNNRKVDAVWEQILDDTVLSSIDRGELFKISSDTIKELYEPRLATKFDHRHARPVIMQENNISILPIGGKKYALGKFDAYHDIPEEDSSIKTLSFPHWIESINPQHITSESVALATANIAHVFQDFFDDESLISTVSGRMGSGKFEFGLGNYSFSVDGSQIEIDFAIESPNQFIIFECKNILFGDFIVRQIYYPYRTFLNLINKPVRTVYITYSNGIYNLLEYQFIDPMRYDSCQCVRQQKYRIDSNIITKDDIDTTFRLINRKRLIQEDPDGKELFPQCDSFPLIVNIMEVINNRFDKFVTYDDIAETFSFAMRQSQYYLRGCTYLGLVVRCDEGKDIRYCLSDQGKRILGLPYKDRQLALSSLILSHSVFYHVFKIYLLSGQMPDREPVAQIMRMQNVKLGESTIRRRAQTVIGWLNWIIGLTK